MIQEEQTKLRLQEKKKKDIEDPYGGSYLLPLISTATNAAGFKYKAEELREINIMRFMDSIRRFQVLESTRALFSGVYGGFLDTSKMNLTKELNFFR